MMQQQKEEVYKNGDDAIAEKERPGRMDAQKQLDGNDDGVVTRPSSTVLTSVSSNTRRWCRRRRTSILKKEGRRSSVRSSRRTSSTLFRSFVLNGLDDLGDFNDISDDEINFDGSFHHSVVSRLSVSSSSTTTRHQHNPQRRRTHQHPRFVPSKKGRNIGDMVNDDNGFVLELEPDSDVDDDDDDDDDSLDGKKLTPLPRKPPRLSSQGSLRFQNDVQSLEMYLRRSSRFRNFVLTDLHMSGCDESIVFENESTISLDLDLTVADEHEEEEQTADRDENNDNRDNEFLLGSAQSDSEVDYDHGSARRFLALLVNPLTVMMEDKGDVGAVSDDQNRDDDDDDDGQENYDDQPGSKQDSSSPTTLRGVALKVLERIQKANSLIAEKKKRREDSRARQEQMDAWETSSQHSASSRDIDTLAKSLVKDFVETNIDGAESDTGHDVESISDESISTIPFVGDVVEDLPPVRSVGTTDERLPYQPVEAFSTTNHESVSYKVQDQDRPPFLDTTASSTENDSILTPLKRKEDSESDVDHSFDEGAQEPSPQSLKNLLFSPILKQRSNKSGDPYDDMMVPDMEESIVTSRSSWASDSVGESTPGSMKEISDYLNREYHPPPAPVLGYDNGSSMLKDATTMPASGSKRILWVLLIVLVVLVAATVDEGYWIHFVQGQARHSEEMVTLLESERRLKRNDKTAESVSHENAAGSRTREEARMKHQSMQEEKVRARQKREEEKEAKRIASEEAARRMVQEESEKRLEAERQMLSAAKLEAKRLAQDEARIKAEVEAKREVEKHRRRLEEEERIRAKTEAQRKEKEENERREMVARAKMKDTIQRQMEEDQARLRKSEIRSKRLEQEVKKVKRFLARFGLAIRSAFLRSLLVVYKAAQLMGVEIKHLNGVAEQLAINQAKAVKLKLGAATDRTVQTLLSTAHVGADKLNQGLSLAGGLASDITETTLRAAQYVNGVAGDVASTHAQIYGSSSNLAGGKESLAYMGEALGSAASRVNDIAGDLAETHARIHHANFHQLGGHESTAQIGRSLKDLMSKILSQGRR